MPEPLMRECQARCAQRRQSELQQLAIVADKAVPLDEPPGQFRSHITGDHPDRARGRDHAGEEQRSLVHLRRMRHQPFGHRQHLLDQHRHREALVTQEAAPLFAPCATLVPADHDPTLEQQMLAQAVASHQSERFCIGVGLGTDRDHVGDDRVGQREQPPGDPADTAVAYRREVKPPEFGSLAQHVVDLGRYAAEPVVDHREHHADIVEIELGEVRLGGNGRPVDPSEHSAALLEPGPGCLDVLARSGEHPFHFIAAQHLALARCGILAGERIERDVEIGMDQIGPVALEPGQVLFDD
ncbi:MAG: hypothetical protein LKM31_13505 [Sphingobium sp.]|nr:hypothetical protein [Sphingobium sp.]